MFLGHIMLQLLFSCNSCHMRFYSPMLNVLNFYIRTFSSMCAAPYMAHLCNSFIMCLPDMSLRHFLNNFGIAPVVPITTVTSVFYIPHALYFFLLLWHFYIVNSNISFTVPYEVAYSVTLSRLLNAFLLSWSEGSSILIKFCECLMNRIKCKTEARYRK